MHVDALCLAYNNTAVAHALYHGSACSGNWCQVRGQLINNVNTPCAKLVEIRSQRNSLDTNQNDYEQVSQTQNATENETNQKHRVKCDQSVYCNAQHLRLPKFGSLQLASVKGRPHTQQNPSKLYSADLHTLWCVTQDDKILSDQLSMNCLDRAGKSPNVCLNSC